MIPYAGQLLVAVGGLCIQAVVGWAYLHVLRSEVALLRERADKHEANLADHEARIRVLEAKSG